MIELLGHENSAAAIHDHAGGHAGFRELRRAVRPAGKNGGMHDVHPEIGLDAVEDGGRTRAVHKTDLMVPLIGDDEDVVAGLGEMARGVEPCSGADADRDAGSVRAASEKGDGERVRVHEVDGVPGGIADGDLAVVEHLDAARGDEGASRQEVRADIGIGERNAAQRPGFLHDVEIADAVEGEGGRRSERPGRGDGGDGRAKGEVDQVHPVDAAIARREDVKVGVSVDSHVHRGAKNEVSAGGVGGKRHGETGGEIKSADSVVGGVGEPEDVAGGLEREAAGGVELGCGCSVAIGGTGRGGGVG